MSEVAMSSNSRYSSGWIGAFAFTGVLAVIGVVGCVLQSQGDLDQLLGQSASKPPLAVAVCDSTDGYGKLLRITNTSDMPVHQVRLTLSGRQERYERVIADTIQPHDTIEFGYTESGFALEKGTRIELRASAYGASFRDTIR